MSEFRSAYSGQVRYTSLTGDGHEPEYQYKVTDNGKELIKIGETDVYALIQSRLEETKIENIIKRATNDPDVLGSQDWQTNGQMVDISNMPTDYHTWYGLIMEAQKEFERLPAEMRIKWDNDVEKFIMNYGTEEWMNKMGMTNTESNKKENKKEEELKNNEQKQ